MDYRINELFFRITFLVVALPACVSGYESGGIGPASGDPSVPVTVTSTGTSPNQIGLSVRPSNPTCVAQTRPIDPNGGATVGLTRVFPGLVLTNAVAMRQVPQLTDRWYVAERGGRLSMFPAQSAVTEAQRVTLLDVSSSIGTTLTGDLGVAGLAIPPRFAIDKRMVLSYNTPSSAGTALSHVVSLNFVDPGTLDPTPIPLIQQPLSTAVNIGGGVQFGTDDLLYLAYGDNALTSATVVPSQDMNSLLGKLLRIDPSKADVIRGKAYSIPASNPYAIAGGAPEIYASGFHSPNAWAFDRERGTLWLADRGQTKADSLDSLVLGKNYGWPSLEGTCSVASCAAFVLPSLVIPDATAALSPEVVAGTVYHGNNLPVLSGVYIFAEARTNTVWKIAQDANKQNIASLLVDASSVIPLSTPITSINEGEDGELYFIVGGNAIYRLDPTNFPLNAAFPQALSQTGCFVATNPTQPVTGLIPYSINAPFWSDGASKNRWIGLPDGAKIHLDANGILTMPTGTVVVKEFTLDNVRVETRLLMKHIDGGWGGYTYRWNAAQTDAYLVPTSWNLATGATTTYSLPNRAQCATCHNALSSNILGWQLGQLDRTTEYGSQEGNQLLTLESIGVIDAPVPASYQAVPNPFDANSASLDMRARTYLAVNCSMCHRPKGLVTSTANFALSGDPNIGVCNTLPTSKTPVPVPATDPTATLMLVKTGNPNESIVSIRMHSLASIRMPAIGSHAVDPNGTALVDSWISNMTTCPP